MKFGGFEAGRPPNGIQAHDLSRELEFVRPAQVGATPFWECPAWEPESKKTYEDQIPLRGIKPKNDNNEGRKVLPMS